MARRQRRRSPAQRRATQRMIAANRARRTGKGKGRTCGAHRAAPVSPVARRTAPRRTGRRVVRISAQQAAAYRRGQIIRPQMAGWDKPVRW